MPNTIAISHTDKPPSWYVNTLKNWRKEAKVYEIWFLIPDEGDTPADVWYGIDGVGT